MMKPKNNRLLLLAGVCSCMMLTGCTNDDYDWDNVDKTLGFGNSLTLPANNSLNVTLDDIFDLGNTDLITIDSNGDYRFGKDPEQVDGVKVKVDPITLDNDLSQPFGFTFNLPDEVMLLPVAVIDCSTLPAEVQEALSPSREIHTMEYEFNVPDEVKSLDYVSLGGQSGISLQFSLTMPSTISGSEVILDLPDVFDIPSGVEAGNVIRLDNPSGTQTIELSLKGIGITDRPEDGSQDYACLENGQFHLKGAVNMTVKIKELVKPASPEVNVNAAVTMEAIRITSAKGIFKPTVNPMTVGTTTINDLPDFLVNEDVVADIDNPQIWLDITSNLPLGGIVEAQLSSSTTTSIVELSQAKGNALPIAADGVTRLVVCRKAPANLKGYTPVIAPDLSTIIRKLREPMTVGIAVTSFEAQQDGPVTVELGHNYEFTPAYQFTAPLALGSDARVIYTGTETGWNSDIDDIGLSKSAVITLTADAVNNVPGDVEVNITPLGLNGNTLKDLTVVPVKNTVAGGSSMPLEFRITDQTGEAFKLLDGIEYRIEVTAPADNNLKGATLNSGQTIRIANATFFLDGKVVIDAN